MNTSVNGIVLLTPYYLRTEKRHRRPQDFHRLNYCTGKQYADQFKLKGAVIRRDRWDRNQDELPVYFQIARTFRQHHEDRSGRVAKEPEEKQNTV